MATIKELDQIVLTTDIPAHGLKAGDIGAVVLVHGGGEGYEVEFVALDGETIAVVSVFANQVRPTSEYRELIKIIIVSLIMMIHLLAPMDMQCVFLVALPLSLFVLFGSTVSGSPPQRQPRDPADQKRKRKPKRKSYPVKRKNDWL